MTVRFYAWWEHPGFVAAGVEGPNGRFDHGEEALRNMRIEAVTPLRCELSPGNTLIELRYATEDPRLWPFEEHGDILCNADVDARALEAALLARKLPRTTREDIAPYLQAANRYRAPFSFGQLPWTLFGPVRDELRRMGVPTLITREPRADPRPALLTVDDTIMIVAEDFVVDVPVFEHRPEWFRPR